MALIFSACSSTKETAISSPAPWRLVPEATVLGDRRQFFVYGKGLDSATVTAPQSVAVEKGNVKSDGRVLTLYLKVAAMRADSSVAGEKAGSREIKVKTPDTSVTFSIKVVDEGAAGNR